LHTLRGIPNLALPFDTVRCRLIAGPSRVSAASTRLIQAFGNRWIAAGDSAQSFDPLSSIGITSAIVSGNNAAAALIHAPSFGAATLRQYQHGLDAEYSAYLSKRHEYYRMEKRWQGMPFWNRRHHAEAPQARRNDPLSILRTGVS
jgi:flavin-dependent dehydrogenase